MKIAIGSDHGGYELKERIKEYLQGKGHDMKDFGAYSTDSVDYTDIALEVGEAVVGNEYDRGILVCGTGLGISIAANKVPGVRAVVVNEGFSAKMSRLHNNANVLCLGGRVTGPDLAMELVDIWMDTSFEGGRHERRVNKIGDIERKYHR